jgi:hypothetical protein
MDKNERAFQTSLDTRKFEIDLFWKRSLFFWGFIASAFVAFAALYKEGSNYAVVIAGFGCICSLVWTLANRGSKFWQENWETKVANLEDNLVGNLFKNVEGVQKKFILLRARKYSVSKLAIALSDYVLIIWVGITLTLVFKYLKWFKTISSETLIVIFVVFTLIYSVYIILFARTSPISTNKSNKRKTK